MSIHTSSDTPGGSTVCVVMPLGPGDAELDRARDTLASLYFHEPLVTDVVIVDDAVPPRDLAGLLPVAPHVRLHPVPHPRKGQGVGSLGGLAEGMLAGLSVAERLNIRYAVKLDTDALVIAPFVRRLDALLAARPHIGMAGLYDREYDNEPRSWTPWQTSMRRLLNRFRPYRTSQGWTLWTSFTGIRAGVRRMIQRQNAGKILLGANVQGGGYVITAEALHRFRREGWFEHGPAWRKQYIGEDIAVSAYVAASGLALVGISAPGEVFGVTCYGLPAPPETLLANGNAIIHSVKSDKPGVEQQIRAFFAERRRPV